VSAACLHRDDCLARVHLPATVPIHVVETYQRKAAFDRYIGLSGPGPVGVGLTEMPGSSVLP
jgi:hypothetical protein